jgi:hypothetical protein
MKSGKHTTLLVLVAMLASWLFTAYNINVSKNIGRLSTVTNYDDVVYLSKAADVYFTFIQKGIWPGVKIFFTESLHAPFTVWDALLGYAIFGFNIINVYYAQIVVVLSYLFFVGWFTQRLNTATRVSIILSSLAIPFASLCVQVFRPDQMSGIVVAGLSVAILTSKNIFDNGLKPILVGIGLGLSLLIKSSTFALILIIIPGSWALTAFRTLILGKSSIGNVLKSGIAIILTAILISGWYWFQHGQELWDYFIVNSFGVNADIWKTPGGIKDHLFFYFQGATLQSSLGLFTVPFTVLLLGGCLYDLLLSKNLERKIIGGGLLWMVVCIFGIFYLQGIKNQYMGGVLYMYLLFGALVYLEIILKTRFASNTLVCHVLAVVIIIISFSLYRYPTTEKVNTVWAKNSKSTTLGLLADLLKNRKANQISILFTQGGPVVPEYLKMMLNSLSIKINVGSAALNKDYKNVINSLAKYEYVVIQDQRIEGRPGFPMPSEEWEPQLKLYLDNNQKWLIVNEYKTLDGKKVYLYVRN